MTARVGYVDGSVSRRQRGAVSQWYVLSHLISCDYSGADDAPSASDSPRTGSQHPLAASTFSVTVTVFVQNVRSGRLARRTAATTTTGASVDRTFLCLPMPPSYAYAHHHHHVGPPCKPGMRGAFLITLIVY